MREIALSWSKAVVQRVVDQVADGAGVDISEGLHVGGEAGPGDVRPEDVGGGGEGGAVGPGQLRHHQASPPERVLPAPDNVGRQVVAEVDHLRALATQHLPQLFLNNNNSGESELCLTLTSCPPLKTGTEV